MENLELLISIMGAVISFLTFLLVAVISFIIKGMSASVSSCHKRLDDHINDNTKEHTGLRKEFVSHTTCDELRKMSMCSR